MPRTLPIALTLALLLLALSHPSQAQEWYALQFKDYPANSTYDGPKAQVKLHRGTKAWQFRTTIKNEYATTPVNFAGHYVAISWGCGAPCQYWALIDARTGVPYFNDTSAFYGADFRSDSTLFVTDPPPANPEKCEASPTLPMCLGKYAVYYRWNGYRLVELLNMADELSKESAR